MERTAGSPRVPCRSNSFFEAAQAIDPGAYRVPTCPSV
jgi:hypothetical protein